MSHDKFPIPVTESILSIVKYVKDLLLSSDLKNFTSRARSAKKNS